MNAPTGAALILAVTRHELRIVLRNRWVLVYAAIFAVLTTAVSYFGLAVIELTGFQGFERTSISLLNLVLYIVPLASMLIAVQSFSREGGTTDQLFCEPVSRAQIVWGKLLGLGLANALATVLGFGFTGFLIASRVGLYGFRSYAVLVAFTILVALAFSSLAALLTILARRSSRAYAVILVVWFVLVLLFDLAIIGLSFLLPEGYANRAAFAGLFANPVDAARV
ncbi:MAG TPA: ABC transporter permease, partial [Firmicutes bacterium]|nr:ABC transporter permease [Bacillota bacterium]